MKELIQLTKLTMTSLEIAELTGKRHDNVLRDIRNIIKEIEDHNSKSLINIDSSNLSSQIKSSTYKDGSNIDREMFILGKADTLLLTTGYSIIQRKMIIDRWQYLEEQLAVFKQNTYTKKHQLEAMEALQHLLPDDVKGEALSYIKANTVVNKVTSNLYGFPKMLKKDEMNPDMLTVRDLVLDDYIKLYEVIGDNSKVKNVLYDKYQPRQ